MRARAKKVVMIKGLRHDTPPRNLQITTPSILLTSSV